MNTIPYPDSASDVGQSVPRPPLPWIPAAIVFGAACITFGIMWDISWHTTIGRDTFWTPAHLMMYLGGTLGGCLGGWRVLQATFWRRSELRDQTVGILGFRGPLGAWVTIWGSVAMLTSAPFDDWWHNAYGLDVKILSPPHALLAAGMYGVVTGALLWVAAERNRRAATGERGGTMLVLAAGGIQLALASILITEVSLPNLQHTQTFYLAAAALYPAFLCAAASHRPVRFSATVVAGLYLAMSVAMVWMLPWFPAEPKLAPIYNRVTHMVPPAFPLLLVVPAFALDLWHLGWRRWMGSRWTVLRILGAVGLFLLVFIPVQWWFSQFLISPMADNAFFAGGRFFGYGNRPNSFNGRFWKLTEDPFTWGTIGWMALVALVSSSFGTAAGGFLQRVRR